jgi:hypothetical protein
MINEGWERLRRMAERTERRGIIKNRLGSLRPGLSGIFLVAALGPYSPGGLFQLSAGTESRDPVIFHGDDGSGLGIASPFASLAKLDFEGSKTAKLDGLAIEYRPLDLFKEGIYEAMDLFAVEGRRGMKGLYELSFGHFPSHSSLSGRWMRAEACRLPVR